MIRLDVVGIPAPQGSKTKLPNGALIEGGPSKTGRAKLRAWRKAVFDATESYVEGHSIAPIAEPTAVTIYFSFPVIKSDPYRHFQVTHPDLDKLIRAVLDQLVQGGLLKDDSYVCQLFAIKQYRDREPAGCTIAISSLAEEETKIRHCREADARGQQMLSEAVS